MNNNDIRKRITARLYGHDLCMEYFGSTSPSPLLIAEWKESWANNDWYVPDVNDGAQVNQILKDQNIPSLHVQHIGNKGSNRLVFLHKEEYICFKLLYKG